MSLRRRRRRRRDAAHVPRRWRRFNDPPRQRPACCFQLIPVSFVHGADVYLVFTEFFLVVLVPATPVRLSWFPRRLPSFYRVLRVSPNQVGGDRVDRGRLPSFTEFLISVIAAPVRVS